MKVIINKKSIQLEGKTITFDQIVELAGSSRTPAQITYTIKGSRMNGGFIKKGDRISLHERMAFSTEN